MSELIYIILLPLSSLLWMLGGWRWKGWRRFILSICLFSACLLFSAGLAKALGVGIICLISTSLPYGENSTWTIRIITAVTFGLIGMPLGVTPLMLVPPAVFLIGWVASNKMGLQHKITEGLTGLAVAIPIAELLHGYIS